MGVTLTANKSKYSFDMGYGGFFNLRKNIAYALNEEFGRHYAGLIHCKSEREYKKHDKIAEKILNNIKECDDAQDIIDFLYASDCDGKISYKTCGKIYDLIKDVDFGNKTFLYDTHSDGKDYEHLKCFLKECYSHRRNACWR